VRQWDYNTHNASVRDKMKAEGLDVEMAYDGLSFEIMA
jgi:hypothetical protein